MEDVIQVQDQFYILATATPPGERRVLKEGDSFAVFDRFGDILSFGETEQGLFHEGTRFLSRLQIRLDNQRPLLLSSRVKQDNELFGADLTNQDVVSDGVIALPRDVLHIFRSRFLWKGVCYERLRLWNYGRTPMSFSLSLEFGADFADIFEVRGTSRKQRGQVLEPLTTHDEVVLAYRGLDHVLRRTRLKWNPPPRELTPSLARFTLSLEPQGSAFLSLTVACEIGEEEREIRSYETAFETSCAAMLAARQRYCDIQTSNEQFNDWLNRSAADLRMMVTETERGLYPYAGVPWFNAPFGRDGIIAALELLWVNPSLARGVLAYLATRQATDCIAEQDAEPGKILHEGRKGEMARLGEVPFGQYYGSVDSTPLFLILAASYFSRTADRAFLLSIWDHIERAIAWIDQYGDLDGDGFVEYARRTPTGLAQQGWKDSHDSVFHADGALAEGPIALCEVQGYVYAAKRGIAEIAVQLGHADRAAGLRREAEALRQHFEGRFWCEELSTYAIALDGEKRPCRVRTSNAGQCLFGGIASPDRARRVAETLFSDPSWSGWGIRTVAASEPRYNPMSYHNGSVWPHDNALIAAGLAAYGFQDLLARPLTGLFDASLFVDLHRLPELFCGFHRRPGEGPTLYPVACAPQAWASGAVFLLLQACLGISIQGRERRVSIAHTILPEFLHQVAVRDLEIGEGRVDLLFERHAGDVDVTVLRKDGAAEVLVIK